MTSSEIKPLLCQINLIVRDVQSSIAFYRRLGLAVEESGPDEWRPHHATLIMDNGMRLELDSEPFAKQWNPGFAARGKGTSNAVLFFYVRSRQEVDSLFERMIAAGSLAQKPPEDAFWGSRYAIVEDPDGNTVGIMSPIDEARSRPPPSPMEWS